MKERESKKNEMKEKQKICGRNDKNPLRIFSPYLCSFLSSVEQIAVLFHGSDGKAMKREEIALRFRTLAFIFT